MGAHSVDLCALNSSAVKRFAIGSLGMAGDPFGFICSALGRPVSLNVCVCACTRRSLLSTASAARQKKYTRTHANI